MNVVVALPSCTAMSLVCSPGETVATGSVLPGLERLNFHCSVAGYHSENLPSPSVVSWKANVDGVSAATVPEACLPAAPALPAATTKITPGPDSRSSSCSTESVPSCGP